jgi:hypothetical protein
MGLSHNLEANLGPRKWPETAALGRRYFARASLRTFFTILYFYSITYMLLPEPMPDSALDVLIKAHLLPQAHQIK